MWANAAFRRLLELDPDPDPDNHARPLLSDCVAPEDRAKLDALFSVTDDGFHEDVRFRRGADAYVWCELTATAASSDGSATGGFVVQLRDVDEQHQRATAQSKATARLAALIGNLNAAVLLEDEDRRIVLTNQAFCDAFGIPAPPEAMVGMDCSNAAEESKGAFLDPEGFVSRIEELLEKREVATGDALDLCDGRHLERDYVPVWVGDEYVGHLWSYRDVTETVHARRHMAKKNEELELLASRDALTDLYNRRAILAHLDAALESSDPVSVISVDLDHFKRVNDQHGHAAGDEALVAVAVALTAGRRGADRVGRVGGEELLVVLPGTGAVGASIVAEACRLAITSLALSFGGLTASFGVASTEGASRRGAPDLLERADTALYDSKKNGRDRVTLAAPES